jgi:Rieske 2Fe-2S family protein
MVDTLSHATLSESVKSLPGRWYTDPDQLDKEFCSVWQNNWIYICSERALSKRLSYKTVTIGKHNVVILRDKEGELRAFHNTCRHRGAELCSEREGTLKSNVLVCPYHQWSYSVSTGALKGMTSFKVPDNFDKEDHGLIEVQLKTWQGLVFINLNSDQPWRPDEVFQLHEELLFEFPADRLVLGHTWRKEVKCNWKVYWENYSECLHCPNIHPELSDLVPVYGRRLNHYKETPDWEAHAGSAEPKYTGGLKTGAETWSMNGSAQGHLIESIAGHTDLAKGQSYSSTFPSMYIGIFGDHVRMARLLPIDSETTELSVEWLFEPSALEDQAYKKELVTEFEILVMEQDAAISELNQRGLSNPAFKQGVLMPEEHAIKTFHDWLKNELGATEES